jgi:Tfp pilus assembly major pilin PilA
MSPNDDPTPESQEPQQLSEEAIAAILARTTDPVYQELLRKSVVADQSLQINPGSEELQKHAHHRANAVKAYEEWLDAQQGRP